MMRILSLNRAWPGKVDREGHARIQKKIFSSSSGKDYHAGFGDPQSELRPLSSIAFVVTVLLLVQRSSIGIAIN
jgi:hypothetical protein